jgi:hypothetical protein
MTTIFVDFNARTEGDRIRLNTDASLRSLAETGAKPGDRVLLTDGELRVEGQLEEGEEGLLAAPAWETLEQIVSDDDVLKLQR